jgi:hypothetical protein
MLIISRLVVLAGIALGLATGATAVVASNGEGHTPVTLCHWVPAHGGSYIVITVDDDGANGNKNLKAHEGHDHDIIPANGEGCDVDPDVDLD